MVDVRKGDKVVIHGRALIDGKTVADAVVTGTSPGNKVTVSIDRGGGGKPFDVPGIASYGPTDDQSNWWEFPADDAARREPTTEEQRLAAERAKSGRVIPT